jgi:hypothetical protein
VIRRISKTRWLLLPLLALARALAARVVRRSAYWNSPPEARLRASRRASLLALEQLWVRQSHMALTGFSGIKGHRAVKILQTL